MHTKDLIRLGWAHRSVLDWLFLASYGLLTGLCIVAGLPGYVIILTVLTALLGAVMLRARGAKHHVISLLQERGYFSYQIEGHTFFSKDDEAFLDVALVKLELEGH